MVRKSRFRLRTASSRTCPASSTPVGPPPTTTTVSQNPADFVDAALGDFQRAEDTPAQLEGVVDGLHPGRDECVLVVTEVGLARPGGDDEAVIRVLPHLAGDGLRHHPALEVEPGDLGQLDGTLSCLRRICAARARSDRARGSRSRPGTGTAGRGGGSADRSASPRRPSAPATGWPASPRSRRRPRRPDACWSPLARPGGRLLIRHIAILTRRAAATAGHVQCVDARQLGHRPDWVIDPTPRAAD